MARIELRHATIRLVDGYSNTAAVNEATPAVDDTTMGVDTLGTANVIPVSSRFTVVGSGDQYTVTVTDANAIATLDLDDASAGDFLLGVNAVDSAVIIYNPSAANIVTALEGIAGVAVGDFTVTGSVADFVITATAAGTFGNIAVVLDADFTGLTSSTPTFVQDEPGGVTHDITFTPAWKTANLPINDAVITVTGRTLEVKVGEGNMTYTESKEFNYDLDRGDLDTVREGDQQPMDWTLDLTWEFLTSIAGAVTPTIEEAFKNTGPAAEWESASADPCEPYAVDIEVEHVPNCSTDQIETTTIPDTRFESLEHDIDGATVSASGRSNATQAIHARSAQVA